VEASYDAIKRGVVHVQLRSELPAIFINVMLGLCRQCLQHPSEEGHKFYPLMQLPTDIPGLWQPDCADSESLCVQLC